MARVTVRDYDGAGVHGQGFGMFLKFHNVDHPDVDLHEGQIVLGSSPECHVMLDGEGVEPHHCRIDVREGKVLLRPVSADAACVLNGRRVDGEVILSAGDLLLLGRLGCQVVGRRSGHQDTGRSRIQAAPPVAPIGKTRDHSRVEHATHVRGTLPRLVLRGLSGPVLGRSFPLRDGLMLGRSRECDIFIESQEISRQHARMRVRPDSIVVEDLNSTNGTFINDQRITTEAMQPGDELRLDTIRFVLVAPGSSASPAPDSDKHAAKSRLRPWRSLAWLVLLLALIVLVWRLWL